MKVKAEWNALDKGDDMFDEFTYPEQLMLNFVF